MSCKRVYLDRYAQPDKGWTDRDEARWPVPFWHIDTGMAALLILHTVVDEGLGAVYFGIVPEAVPQFRAAFGVPDDHEPIGAIAIGYDAEPRRATSGRGGVRRTSDPLRPVVTAPGSTRAAAVSLAAGWRRLSRPPVAAASSASSSASAARRAGDGLRIAVRAERCRGPRGAAGRTGATLRGR